MNFKKMNLYFLFFLLLFYTCKEKDKDIDIKPPVTPPQVSLHPNLKLVTTLNEALDETSGLLFYNDFIYTHNDRGWPNEIYIIDTLSGHIQNTIILLDAESVDYEDMAESPNHIFVADVGNNFGNRDDLCIYRINKSLLVITQDTLHVNTEKITYVYEDQDSLKRGKGHNFDCEAVIFYNDSLFLFTKNRLDEKCNLYVIPATPGHHTARLISNFDTKGLITGADISHDKSKVVLIGYNKDAKVFLWVFTNFSGSDFFSGNAHLINLGSFNQVGQAEAVCFYGSNKLFISSEKTSEQGPKLYRFHLD